MNISKILGTGFFQNNSGGWVTIGTLWMRFTCCPNLMFLAYLWLETHRFSNWSFCWLRAIQNWYSFPWLWGSENWLYLFILMKFGQLTVILLGLCKTLGLEKQCKPFPFDKKFKNHPCDLAQVIFNDSISGNQELGSQLINKLQKFNLLFIFLTGFVDKICIITVKLQNVL